MSADRGYRDQFGGAEPVGTLVVLEAPFLGQLGLEVFHSCNNQHSGMCMSLRKACRVGHDCGTRLR